MPLPNITTKVEDTSLHLLHIICFRKEVHPSFIFQVLPRPKEVMQAKNLLGV